MLDAIHLGASLYIPSTHPTLSDIASGTRLSHIRSLIFCTEDAVNHQQLPAAMHNLAKALAQLQRRDGQHRFVRVRNPDTLRQVLSMPNSEALDGFVLPKVTAANLDNYLDWVDPSQHKVMPTLETRECFCEADMRQLLALIDQPARREKILCLRIGGNDLLSLLRLRRPRGRTLYETPLGVTISQLATTFIPYGFSLSAPVFEYLDDPHTLAREIEQDLNHGLTGKTAIHPDQVALIERHYPVRQQDMEAAQRILAADAPGVFCFHQSMCEPATHQRWAQSILRTATCYGSHAETPDGQHELGRSTPAPLSHTCTG